MPQPNFPDSPTVNQEYTYSGSIWVWTGQYWRVQQAPSTNNNFIPAANVTYDLGSANQRWRDLYLSGNTMYLGAAALSSSGSGLNLPAGSTVGGTAVASTTDVVNTIATAVIKISNIQVTGNTFVPLDDTAVDTAGGFVRINGAGFVAGCSVLIGSQSASAVSFLSATALGVTVPALSAGTYTVYVTNPDGSVAIRVNGLNYSGVPSWTTATGLTDQFIDSAISIQLSANSNSTVSYTLQGGSSLPPGITLSNVGLLSGTVTGLVADTTYTFTVVATDLENQDTPRTFTVTIVTVQQIARSLRYNFSDTAYLSRTPGSAGNRKTWTFSCWIKRSKLSTTGVVYNILSTNYVSNNGHESRFDDNDSLKLVDLASSNTTWVLQTNALYRDVNAWYHIVIAFDSPQATASERVKLYVNGSRVTSFATATYPSQNYDSYINSTLTHYIGAWANNGTPSRNYDGYLAETYFIDGQALAANSFGRSDVTTGTWVPIRYTGTYGTNGFYLNFSDTSNNTNTTLGKDYSGNSNNWTPNNFTIRTFVNPYVGYNIESAVDGVFGSSSNTAGQTQAGGTARFITGIPYNTLTVVYGNMSNFNLGNSGSGATLSINGTNVAATGTYGTSPYSASLTKYYTTSTPGTLNSIGITGQVPGDYEAAIFEIIINGSQLVATYLPNIDALVDSPSAYGTDTGLGNEIRGGYATLNPLVASQTAATLSNGNMDVVTPTTGTGKTNYGEVTATIGVSSGKWYWEVLTVAFSGTKSHVIGIDSDANASGTNGLIEAGNRYSYASFNGNKYSGATGSSYGATYDIGDIVGVALDLDTGSITFYKNGVSQGVAFTGLTGTYFPAMSDTGGGNATLSFNFGQRPFAYAAPASYKALNTANLPVPTIGSGAQNQARNYFDVITYTGNGSTQTITGLNFQPDFVWIKNRDANANHRLFDSVRGADKILYSSLANSEATDATTGLTAFTSNGFSIGSAQVNDNGQKFVAWCWRANTTTVVNTAGTISANVRANPTSGFSIITYAGNGVAYPTGATVGHGLSAAPQFIITKNRNTANNWNCYHVSVATGSRIDLNSTAAATGDAGAWNSVTPTSTVFSIGNTGNTNISGAAYVAYCFAPVPGFSAFGSYTGNGSTDGPFVYLGFRPRWLLVKNITFSPTNWILQDTARSPNNVSGNLLLPDSSVAEILNSSADYIDILSNGFKVRNTGDSYNRSSSTIIYAAFAETPLKYTRAR